MLNGIMPWEGTKRTQAKENTEILKIEGDEPKGTMEMRKASMQQRSDWPENVSIKKRKGQQLLRWSLDIPCCREYCVLLLCGYYYFLS